MCLDADIGVSIVMPYMVNGSLLDYLKRERANTEFDDDHEKSQVSFRAGFRGSRIMTNSL